MSTQKSIIARGSQEAVARSVLERNETFRVCSPATRAALLTGSAFRHYEPGKSISSRGEPVKHLGLVIFGSVEIGSTSADGKRFVRWYLEPGQALGLTPVLDGKGAMYDSYAHGETVLLLIPRQTMLAALASDAALSQALLLQFCNTNRLVHDVARSDALFPLAGRVASTILRLAHVYGESRGDGITIALKLSQEQFAAMLAVPRQRVNRELKALERQGLIELAYSQITVRDPKALKALCFGEAVAH